MSTHLGIQVAWPHVDKADSTLRYEHAIVPFVLLCHVWETDRQPCSPSEDLTNDRIYVRELGTVGHTRYPRVTDHRVELRLGFLLHLGVANHG